MIGVSSAIIANCRPDILRYDSTIVGQQLVQALICQVWRGFQSLIQIRHVSVVMLVVMEFHGGFIDVWFQSVCRVGKWWKCKCHIVSEVHSTSYNNRDALKREQVAALLVIDRP